MLVGGRVSNSNVHTTTFSPYRIMGRMGTPKLVDTPPNVVLSDSDSKSQNSESSQPNYNPDIPDNETNVSLQTVPCSKCDRSFTLERVRKHEAICNNIKARKVYDIVKMRVKGTETEKLVKEGMYIAK